MQTPSMEYPEFEEHQAFIASPSVQDAHARFVQAAASITGIRAKSAKHGRMSKTLRLYEGPSWAYTLVVNRGPLLFYLRHPHVTHPTLTVEKLQQVFPTANQRGDGEITLRLASRDDVDNLLHRVFAGRWQEPKPRAASTVGGVDASGQGKTRLPDWRPDEVTEDEVHVEGALRRVTVNAYERNPDARRRCIERHKPICQACTFDFEATYGDIGLGFIHVHHKVELSSIGGEYVVDPIKDLVPVCPNCHAMLHTKKPALTIEELRDILHTQRMAKPD